MVNQNLVMYIQNATRQGADINSVRAQLIAQGHNPYEVDAAINFLFSRPSQVHHTISFSKSALVAIFAVVLGIALSVYLVFFLTGPSQPAKLLDFETHPIKTAVKPGETITFQIRLFNMGAAKRYDVTVNAQVVSSGGAIVAKKADTFAVEKRTTETMAIEIPPAVSPGTYSVKSTATYSKGIATSSFEFRVYQESVTPTCFDNKQNQGEAGVDCGGPCAPCPTCSDRRQNQGELGVDCGGPCPPCEVSCENCDDQDPCTADSCKRGQCVNEPIQPCCGNAVCETGETESDCPADCESVQPQQTPEEIIEKAVQTSKTDPDRAGEICSSLRELRDKDQCFELVGESVNQSSFCDHISSVSKRDACYVKFAMQGDYSVCEKVENHYLKKSCESLKYLSTET